MTHADTVPLSELHRGSHGVSRISVGFDADGSRFVEWAPPELRPFALRYRFWSMVDEELSDDDPRKYVEWVGPPEVLPPDSSQPVEWTWRHEHTLRDNAYAFLRYAEHLSRGRLRAAIQTRVETLALDADEYRRMRPDQLPDVYLVALVRYVAGLRREGWRLEEIAVRRLDMSRKKLYLRLAEAKRRGLTLTSDEDRATVPKPPPASPQPSNPSTPGVQKPGNKPDGRDDPRDGESR